MLSAVRRPLPFYLKADIGERFALFHAPAGDGACRGAILFVHAFGDEMNKSRRMAARQAAAFVAAGWAVLQIDLHGCGDSSGDFGDARWDTWHDDLERACDWLGQKVPGPVSLCGLRLGGLLAVSFALRTRHAIDAIVLWEPVTDGAAYLTQLLRMRLAGDVVSSDPRETGGTQALRGRLAAGESIEVAGYDLAPALADAIDALRMEDMAVPACPMHWFRLVPDAGRAIAPATARVVRSWERQSARLQLHTVACEPFWATQEIAECPALLSATAGIFAAALP